MASDKLLRGWWKERERERELGKQKNKKIVKKGKIEEITERDSDRVFDG